MESNLSSQIEAILFAAGDPVAKAQLQEATNSSPSAIDEGIAKLKADLADRGLRLTEHNNSFSLVTAPETTQSVERFLGAQARTELTKPALESLAIIAYKQPVSKSQIEEIRGVASDQTIKSLLLRGLIIEDGQSSEPGRPTLYSTSHKFLQLLGLTHVNELQPLEEVVKDDQPKT
jgi:segregation and condensation protein B